VDATLADVFTLLSLFFLTIGRTKEGPATYSQIASMRVCGASLLWALLEDVWVTVWIFHIATLRWARFISNRQTNKVMDRYSDTLLYLFTANSRPHERVRRLLHKIVQDDKNGGKHPVSMTKLLERELNHCGAVFLHLHADCVAVSDISTCRAYQIIL
jgi:hypothetical protein